MDCLGIGATRRTATVVATAWAAFAAAVAAGGWPQDHGLFCGDSEAFAGVEVLALQRDNVGTDRPFVIDGDTLGTALGNSDVQFATAPGVRIFVGRHGAEQVGWELGYAGVYGMWADAAAYGPENLEVASTLASALPGFRNGSTADVTNGSSFQTAEANLLLTSIHMRPTRHSAYELEDIPAVGVVDWIAGFRWANLEEQATLAIDSPSAGGTSTYTTRTSNDLFGGQIGGRGRLAWEAWALEGWIKAGIAGVDQRQAQDPILDRVVDDVYRPGGSGSTSGVAGLMDTGIMVVRRLSASWSLRIGYSSYWITNVALAPDQFDLTNATVAPTAVRAGRTVWLGGANLGLEATW